MLTGQQGASILEVENGALRILGDSITGSYSIGLRTDKDVEWKYISKELHDLLWLELGNQEGNK